MAKLFAEAVEAIDPQPVEGIRATGANLLEEIVYGVIPQVMPLWISYALYRFESNVRSDTPEHLPACTGMALTGHDRPAGTAATNGRSHGHVRSQGSGLGVHGQFSGRCFGSKV